MSTETTTAYDVLAVGAHPDDLEVMMGGTAVKLVQKGLCVLFVNLCDGEPTRHAAKGLCRQQAAQVANTSGVNRLRLEIAGTKQTPTYGARKRRPKSLRTSLWRSFMDSSGFPPLPLPVI